MNSYAYRTTGLAIQTLSALSKAKVKLHGAEKIPKGSIIFVINHFTRIETILLPYHIHRLTRHAVWSLADYGLFKGAFGSFLEQVGAVSTKNPDRDLLIVKTLLTGEADWIIFPEGRMVKSKKIVEKGRFMVSFAGGKHPPHTGAATLALRTEFYRQRLHQLAEKAPEEAERLKDRFGITSMADVSGRSTFIVPVNITYYPIRAKRNILSKLATQLVADIPDRAIDEIMTEGTMLISGSDLDIRFGDPIPIKGHLENRTIQKDVKTPRPIYFNDPLPSKPKMRKEALKIMNRYMTAIYGMTTVNHDHLFASMLKHIPYKRISEDALRRKVYYLTLDGLEHLDIHCHESLSAGQVHLVTDDRFNKVKDILTVAAATGATKTEEGVLIKDPAKFASLFDFNRARIDNPVAVIANEVEPLKKLQARIRRIAWLPDFWVRRKIAENRSRAARNEFEKDYAAYFKEGESKGKEVGAPFLIRGRRGRMGIVLIHGYMAAPMEVRLLAEYLGKQGFWVYVPRLPGHGTAPEDLASRTYKDWVAAVDEAYAVISSLCRQVVAGGFSNGAGLALNLASRVQHLAGVFAISPPMQLQDFSARFVPAVDAWNSLMRMVHLDEARKEFVENHPENPHINYLRNPISGVRELERLMEAVEEKLPDINIPALIVQAVRDPVVSPSGTKKVFNRLGSDDKAYILFNFDRHGILLGPGSRRVHRAVANFLNNLECPEGADGASHCRIDDRD